MHPRDYRRWLRGQYKINPRNPWPPTWYQARSFVKALIEQRIGYEPHYKFAGVLNVEWMQYTAKVRQLRRAIMEEDYPINA